MGRFILLTDNGGDPILIDHTKIAAIQLQESLVEEDEKYSVIDLGDGIKNIDHRYWVKESFADILELIEVAENS